MYNISVNNSEELSDDGKRENGDLQSVKLCRSQEKQLGKDGQIIPIQAPEKT